MKLPSAAFFLLFAPGLSVRAAEPPTVLARVGNADITAADVRPYLANLDPGQEAALAKDPAALNQFLRTLIVQRLLLKEASAAQWGKQPEVIAQLDRVRENALAESYLGSVAKVPADYPTEADVQAAYDANKSAFLVSRQFRVAQIYIAAPGGSDQAPAKLATVEKSLKSANADFAKLAAANSDEAASAERGGEVGWLAESQMQPGIRKAVTALSKGAVSAPLRLDDGWHILKILDVKEAYTASLAEVRDALVQRLRAAKARQLGEAYVTKLLEQNPVAINEIAVSQLLDKTAH
ncbi:MAG: peptidylprolyl isomerase [Terrimicrobiaceae bacterium]|nr:peptidylprolyl isomerase [Terrimicrobiaceae bacterium]